MNEIYAQAKSVVTTDVGVYALLLQKTSEKFFALNQVATVIWRGINLSREPKLLREFVSQHFTAVPESNELDNIIAKFIKSLLDSGLVEITTVKVTSDALTVFKKENLPLFEEPLKKEISRDWLKANRPETFYRIMWGGAHQDLWSPSGTCPN